MKREQIQTEVDAAYLYSVLAEAEKDEAIATIFREMCEIEKSHALAFLQKSGQQLPMPAPSMRAKILKNIGKVFGNDYILGVLMDTEKRIAGSIINHKKSMGESPTMTDTAHVSILQNILDGSATTPGSTVARFEQRHKSVGGNALRAAVLGGNDGLVSNFSLIMGVAGAAGGQKEVLLAGTAGLLAGALSMALGEWISVKSSQELYENQMELEMEELEANPEGERRELTLIYVSKGMPRADAEKMAAEIIQDKAKAHEILVKEELGINAEDLQGSAMEAAVTSFVLFAIGAIIPLVPYFFTSGYNAIWISAAVSAVGLFLIGAAITLFTGKNVWYSGMRQVLFGLAAATVTYGIGILIGVSLS